jgi:predicted DNA-binding transcriptional regulator YafY
MSKPLLNKLVRLDFLIRIKGTGTPKQLAMKLDVSERTLYEYIGIMKDFGAPIKYSKLRRSYYYHDDGEFKISFQKKHVN